MPAVALNVVEKVLILFLMIFAGYACGKLRLITENGAQEMTSVLFYIVTPCLIVSSLQNTIGRVEMKQLVSCGVLSVLAMVVCILVSLPFFRRSAPGRGKVLRFAAAYSNCGFIGLPLAQATVGDIGTAYASMFIAVYNFFVWTHGLSSMQQGQRRPDLKRLLLNPGILGLAVGLPLFAFSAHLPNLILVPVQSLADLNTPLAMLVIGAYMSHVPVSGIFRDRSLYALAAVRLALIPAVCFALMLALGTEKTLLTSLLILAAAPSGANTVMFAAQFDGDAELASKSVALTTILSMVTLPVFTVAARLL